VRKPHRARTHSVRVGSVRLGHGAPVRVQSMTNTKTQNVRATLQQIKRLQQSGCEMVRVAVPDTQAVQALEKIVKGTTLPVIADIHFDYTLALGAIAAGVAKIRINPGNMGLERSLEVAKAAAKKKVAIRIGVNSGSIPEKLRQRAKGPDALGRLMANTAIQYAKAFEKVGVRNIVLSVKSSDARTSQTAYRALAAKCLWPVHLGITEAGGVLRGSVKTAAGLSPLLLEGIGDTIRVSLTDDPVIEIEVANILLSACGVRQRGVDIISCPTCGRTVSKLNTLLARVENALAHESHSLTVAVMGCVVNGPGEARHADVGIAGTPDGAFMLFSKGRALRRVTEKQAVTELLKEVKKWCGRRNE
jgi:(E)-4-hydroxy-3-methylbut-2-enyl-diphosphate synthase